MEALKSPNPLVLLLNEIDILLAQMRLMELCINQAQAKIKYERERSQQNYETELAAMRQALAESRRVHTDRAADSIEAELLESVRRLEDELNSARHAHQSQIENLQYELSVRERALSERQEALSLVELALYEKIQVLHQDLARLRSENAALREQIAEAEQLRREQRQLTADPQEADLRIQNRQLRTALSGAQALQRSTEAKLDELRLEVAEARLMVESRAAEIYHLKKQVIALNQQLAERVSFSRSEIEQNPREEIERLLHEAEEKSQILQNRNDELVTVKSAMDALQERLSEIETTASGKENAALAELARMRSEFQAELAFYQAELSQKDWALQEREAMSQSVEQGYRREIDSLRQLLTEEKSRTISGTADFTIGETQKAPDVSLPSDLYDRNRLDSSAQRRRWHTGFAWKRRWKASETK